MTIQSKLGRWDLTMLVVSFVIGVGIFKTPSIIAEKAGTPFIFYASWIVGGFISVCGALTFAEIGARLPAAGGYYRIFSYCYHPAFAFMFNWALVIINAGSAVAVALVGAEYIKPVIIPEAYQASISTTTIAFTILTILFILNYLGIKMGSRVQNVLSSLKIIMILLLCLAVFGNKNIIDPPAIIHQSAGTAFAAMGLCLIKVFFSCGGYQNTINLGADIKNPQRNIPLAIFGGMSIVVTLYLLINIAYVQVLGFENMKGKPLLAAELAKSFFGDIGFKITAIIIFTSVLGFLNASFMSNPRTYYAMAEDKILPAIFKKVNSRTQTQEFGLTFFFGVIVLSLFLLNGFDQIVNYIIFIDNLALVFAAVTIFILRKKMKDAEYTGYRMKLFPLLPVLFIVVLLWVCLSVFTSDIKAALIGIGIFFAGYPLFLLLRMVAANTKPSA
jgi:basic amino acid/polyamine antiporter, APA family